MWNNILLSNEDYGWGGVTVLVPCTVGDHEATRTLCRSSFGVFLDVIYTAVAVFCFPVIKKYAD